MNKGLLGKIVGVITGTSVLAGAVFAGVQKSSSDFSRLTADAYNILLNNSNSPTLVDGSATIVDEKGVTWEYYNASDNSSGHIALSKTRPVTSKCNCLRSSAIRRSCFESPPLS